MAVSASKVPTVPSKGNLMHSYYFYSALLAMQLIAMIPLAALVCNNDRLKRANELKQLAPFWVISGLYITTSPDPMTALALLRTYVAARFVMLVSYMYDDVPKMAKELAYFVSYAISAYMGTAVLYSYKNAL